MTSNPAPKADLDAMPDDKPEQQSEETRSLTPEQEAQRKQLKRIYITLVLGGLAFGGLVSVVVVLVMRYFGLTEGVEG